MTLGDFSDDFIAEVDDFGEFHSKTPSNAYQNPSQFDTIQESQSNYTWFELKILKSFYISFRTIYKCKYR